ncbi:hypothetical protein [Dethiosulfatarculus sandiegensis]|uniref:Uncharacterized protein n=1 Tax=Dethiosulfatarculus sandiegensis TaxID=1429043 RepID=A0A0D2J8J4_9BACT|nr:hypothetical protein [Dethiosulfatarculus sandiegensis]KIX12001.1 hypothetical protein X474_21105 [Dethiosulfatarculus sandiegensis]
MAVFGNSSQAKSFFKSKTMLGILAAGLGILGQRLFGANLDEETTRELAGQLIDGSFLILEGGGLGLAVWGRLKAKQPLELPGKGGSAAIICLFLLIVPNSAWAGEGIWQSELMQMSLLPLALNLTYALIAFLVTALLWFCVLDKLMLRGFSTSLAIKQGNLAAACFAGLGFLGLAVMVGLVVG